MDIAFDFRGDPLGGVIHNCEFVIVLLDFYLFLILHFQISLKR